MWIFRFFLFPLKIILSQILLERSLCRLYENFIFFINELFVILFSMIFLFFKKLIELKKI